MRKENIERSITKDALCARALTNSQERYTGCSELELEVEYVTVYTADTVAVHSLKLDETVVTPASAPLVLDDKVADLFLDGLGVDRDCRATLPSSPIHKTVIVASSGPFLISLSFAAGSDGLTANLASDNFGSEADQGDSVVKLSSIGAGSATRGHDSTRVVSPGSVAGRDTDHHGSLLELGKDI